MGRWFRPAGFVLAGLFLFLPFVAVSCDAPGGFGRAAPGGTTTYSGIDLMVGGSPDIAPPAKVREGTDQRLAAQPLIMIATLFMLAGAVVAVALQRDLPRRAINMGIAGAAALLLVANQLTVRSLLQDRLREQLAGQNPPVKPLADYVQNQSGFILCLSTLVLLVMVNGLGWLRSVLRP